MASRVLATDEARATITQMQSLLSGGLADQVNQLDQQGQRLCDPNVWDGALAAEFRGSVWPQCNASLKSTLQALEQLQTRLQQINANIMAAGGNA
jgi:uncharacterized protein YukE